MEGNYCYRYPHPAVTADAIVFGFDGTQLKVLLIERGGEPYKGYWAAPGGFVNIDETVEDGAARELLEETGLSGIHLEQYHVYSAVHRDPRERIITAAFFGLARLADCAVLAGDDAAKAAWYPVNALPPMAFDHDQVVRMAYERLQERLCAAPHTFSALPASFTLAQLRALFEAVMNRTYDADSFNRQALATGLLQPVPSAASEAQYQFATGAVSAKRYPFDF